ncbi:variable large family protein [Borreliella burgdorferi]|uniref:variable large family protein n=1 Tax=Borreliella burgdorferi TaxID=139 RepID=UPI001E50518B|nr:variable large family protein [Borreliella burgdorferi]MCD2410083.1 variable large family protein [Borreliella burgdorferi]MCD2415956.1 variable large family protein [Borreliella burgdorferi]
MKKISSAIIIALIALTSCKTDQSGGTADSNDPKSQFLRSLTKLGNDFIDVFTAFGGLIADSLGLKGDPKKDDVQKYFKALSEQLKKTKESLEKLKVPSKETSKGAEAGVAGAAAGKGAGGNSLASVGKVSGWLEKMSKGAAEAEKAATGGDKSVGDNAANGVAADAGSVTGIAKGIKAIVEAAKEAGKEAGKEITLEQGKEEEADTNKEAGKLFGTTANAAGAAGADDARKGAAAVTAASGQQILSAIVEAASSTEGKRAGDAKNAVEAAIGDGDAAEFGNDDMKKRSDRIAAAIALRGMAKGGKFSAQAGGGGNAAAKGAAGAAVAKALGAVTEIVRKAVEAGLQMVAADVKKAGDGSTGSVGE